MRHNFAVAALSALVITAAAAATTACGSSSSGDSSSKTITVAYQKFGTFIQMDQHMQKIKTEYEKAHPGYTVKLNPIEASENDYYTKLTLMNRSPKSAPDVMYEDTFLVNTDIQAGFLAPIDDYLKDWADWSQFTDAAKTAAKAQDGKTYGVPMGTDTRGSLVQQGSVQAGRAHRSVGAQVLERHPHRRAHHQGQASRRHATECVLGEGGR